MAAVANVQTVNITINDIPVEVPKGELIVESVKRIGLEVPIFCYHPRMKPVGMCRMCLVEIGFKQPDGTIRKMPKPQTACSLPASEGLAIYTDTELVHKDRRGVLEFLLVNHPLDCPVCDRGGECPLQNNTLFYGPSTSRFVELKRHAPKAFPLSKYVKLDLERCIQCGRCVRFTEEISGDAQLAFRFRGAGMQPSTFQMTSFDSKFSGNVIEICPVGALTSALYRFRARPWDLQSRPTVCTLCSNGCNIHLDYRVNQIVRVNGRTNEAVNEEWTCDRGKFGHDVFNSEARLTKPLVRSGNSLSPAEWSTAFDQILSAFKAADGAVAAIGGSTNSNEDIYMLQRLFRSEFRSNNLDHRFTKHLPAEPLATRIGVGEVSNTIASLEEEKAILVFATSLADELPIVYLRVRKAWFKHGTKVIVASSKPTDADSFAHLILRYKPGTEATLAAGIATAAGAKGADARLTPEYVESVTGVKAADLQEAATILSEAKAPVVTSRSIYNLDHGQEAADHLASFALNTGSKFNLYGLDANDQGAAEIGLTPFATDSLETGLNTHQILEACIHGKIKALWLVGVDPFKAHHDLKLVTQALESVDFLVVQHWEKTEAASYASVVLPMAAPTEAEGTYTNLERRVQRTKAVLPLRGEAKASWRIFAEVALRVRPQTPLFNVNEILARISAEVPAFASVTPSELDGEGAPLA
jgi:NADH-quinone oxidoreductase subunit G